MCVHGCYTMRPRPATAVFVCPRLRSDFSAFIECHGGRARNSAWRLCSPVQFGPKHAEARTEILRARAGRWTHPQCLSHRYPVQVVRSFVQREVLTDHLCETGTSACVTCYLDWCFLSPRTGWCGRLCWPIACHCWFCFSIVRFVSLRPKMSTITFCCRWATRDRLLYDSLGCGKEHGTDVVSRRRGIL